jgi:alpha-ketoglutarate-dependent taurine dioxygenase
MKTKQPLNVEDDAELSMPRRKTIRISQEELVQMRALEKDLPLLIQPKVKGIDPIAWARNNRALAEEKVLRYGALLFRGFEIVTAEAFQQFIEALSGPLLEYRERSSPRSFVSENIYTSTDHPPDYSIFLHNENSYQQRWPMKIFFFALRPSQQGGETPIADCRRVFQRLAPEIKERFMRKKWMYVRNFGDGLGLDWQTVFQTSDKSDVENYCNSAGINFEWKPGNRLRTWAVRPAVAKHPSIGEMTWFNHATFFHVSTLEPQARTALLAEFSEIDLPTNSYYGDGSPIEADILEELRAAYRQETVAFAWRQGDVLMLDNMLVAHGRAPFVGPREILVGMSQPMSWEEIQKEDRRCRDAERNG